MTINPSLHIIADDHRIAKNDVSDYLETLFSDINIWKQFTAVVSDHHISNFNVSDYMGTRFKRPKSQDQKW